MYTFLQKLAVGLEQVVLDQSVYDGRFMEEFNEAEFKLKTVSFSSYGTVFPPAHFVLARTKNVSSYSPKRI